jgi:hypothetical protein
MTPSQLSKLEEAYQHGCTDDEAASYACITLKVILDKKAESLREKDGWLDKIELLKHKNDAISQVNLGKSIVNGSIEDSKYWLERKKRKEFGARATLDISAEKPLIVLPVVIQKQLQDQKDGEPETPVQS